MFTVKILKDILMAPMHDKEVRLDLKNDKIYISNYLFIFL